jgi:hypothetical protein
MIETFDTYCIETPDLDVARLRVEQALPLQFVLHESMYWGGDYYLAISEEFGKISIRRNQNSYTKELNEPDHPECQIVVSVSEAPRPDALKAMLATHGVRLVNRSILRDGKPVTSDSVRYLIPVGFYREFRGGKPYEPSLRDFVQATATSSEAHIVRYLNTGKVLFATSGVVSDVLDPDLGIIGPPHILTDGTYAWPATLAHYVKHHHVRLPAEFISHMAASNWAAPSEVDMNALEFKR